jgi:hypothetical protein
MNSDRSSGDMSFHLALPPFRPPLLARNFSTVLISCFEGFLFLRVTVGQSKAGIGFCKVTICAQFLCNYMVDYILERD